MNRARKELLLGKEALGTGESLVGANGLFHGLIWNCGGNMTIYWGRYQIIPLAVHIKVRSVGHCFYSCKGNCGWMKIMQAA